MGFRLNRRAFLAGAAGTVVSLPFLEIMEPPRARATDGRPMRYMVAFGGMSVGQDSDEVTPSREGSGYDLTRGLAPLGGRQLGELAAGLEANPRVTTGLAHDSVRDEFSVVSGLLIPWGGSSIPAGGRPREFHGSSVGPLLSGVRTSQRSPVPEGPTSDQLVADMLAAEASRFRSLEYRVQTMAYRGSDGGPKGRMSYRMEDGRVMPNDPIASPRIAFDQLFRGFSSDDPAVEAARMLERARERSVLDLVKAGSDRLMRRLGTEDRQRMDRYFTELRELEVRIEAIDEPTTSACYQLDDPGEDPSADFVRDDGEIRTGYAQEDERARIMCDLIHMAFTCDLTRTASMQLTYAQSFLNAEPILGRASDVHELGHGGGAGSAVSNMADAFAWHTKHLAYLVDKMRSTPDGAGTLLDHTALVFLTEGGRGHDPEAGRDGSSHSTENMVALVAGRAGGLQGGQHIRATGEHPASVILTAMRAVGHEGNLGEIADEIAGLRA